MDNNSSYIDTILRRLRYVNDPELVLLVKRLIDERDQLSRLAYLDTLTGVYNRRILNYVDDVCAVVMCDIDNFKGINDRYGHDIGDEAIKFVSSSIRKMVRSTDYVCRLGGDEFLVIFTDCSSRVARDRIDDIRKEIAENSPFPFAISLSFGFVSNENVEEVPELIKKADTALYMSKENGKNQVTDFRIGPHKVKKKSFYETKKSSLA